MKQQYRIDIRMLSGGYEGPGAAFNEDFFITNDIVNTPQMYMFGMPMRFDARQYQIRNSLTAGYIKANTIYNEQDYACMCNIEYVKADHILIRISVAGVDYDFLF